MKDFLECHLSEKYCFLQYVKKTRLLLKNHWQKKMRKFILFSSRSQMPYLIPGNFCNKKWSPKPDVKVPLGKKHVSLLDNAPNYLLVGCVIQLSPHFLPYVSPSCTLYYNFANAQTWVGNKNWRPSKYLWFYNVKTPTL